MCGCANQRSERAGSSGNTCCRPARADRQRADPYFGGAGPARTGCVECGSCMTGCRYGAKNTLLKNYLGLAESGGAQVIPMTTVTGFEQRSDGVWKVRTVRTGRWLRKKKRAFTATHVVLAAGTWGTQHLLFKMREKGHVAETVQSPGCVDPDQLRIDRWSRPVGGQTGPGLDSRGGHHVVDPPHVRHPHRTLPLWQGLQLHGAAAESLSTCLGCNGNGALGGSGVVEVRGSGGLRRPGDVVPGGQAVGHLGAIVIGGEPMAAGPEMRGDHAGHRQEPLGCAGGAEAFHGAFAVAGSAGASFPPGCQPMSSCCDESGGRFMLVAERAMAWSAWRLLSWRARSARCVVGVCGG